MHTDTKQTTESLQLIRSSVRHLSAPNFSVFFVRSSVFVAFPAFLRSSIREARRAAALPNLRGLLRRGFRPALAFRFLPNSLDQRFGAVDFLLREIRQR